MRKSIQTPLVSGAYYKSVDLKIFIVSSDSLARLMWRGFELHCNRIPRTGLPELDDLVVVECRVAGRKACSYRVGYVQQADDQTLTLCYEDDCFREDIADWSIPMNQVKRVWSVDRVCRVYAHMRKFYPTQSVRDYPNHG